MANVKQCDNCKKMIEDIHIKLEGYDVSIKKSNRKLNRKFGYEIRHSEDFCSFKCLAEYASKQQELLDANIEVINEYIHEQNQ